MKSNERCSGTRKIADLPLELRQCHHPAHEIPGMVVFEPGVYEHICPGCGRCIEFTVLPGPTLRVDPALDLRDYGITE